jgi:lipoprotein signal peptidase
LFAGLLIFDALTKYLAATFLADGRYICVAGTHFVLHLTFNKSGMGSILSAVLHGSLNRLLTCAVALLLMAGSTLLLARTKWRIVTRVVVWIIGYFGLVSVALFASRHITVSSAFRVQVLIVRDISGIALYLALFVISKKKLFRVFVILGLAAAFGNAFVVKFSDWSSIDFMIVPFLWQTIHLGTFNFADIYIILSYLVLIGFLIKETIAKIRPFRSAS